MLYVFFYIELPGAVSIDAKSKWPLGACGA
jgi:hypothetical protein